MKKTILFAAGAIALGLAAWLLFKPAPQEASAAPEPGARLADVILPATLTAPAQTGKRAYDAVCAACHGRDGAGLMNLGPPLVHRIYEPSHHGDMAFVLAVQRGVRAHHWPFGDMPPQEGLTAGDVKNIIRYVREVQAANGIH